MPAMSEDSHRFWDLVLKAVAAVAFIVPVTVGYWQSLNTARLEAMKPFLAKQLDLCVTIADAASTIATVRTPSDRDAAKDTFQRLYWGSMAIFDNEPLADAMRKFKTAWSELPQESLPPLAEHIAHRCKDLARAWQANVFSWR